MRKVRITTGLSCLMAFILCFVIFGSNLAMSYDTVVNGMLGVQTSKAINDESVADEDTVYYKSAYGDINAKTLKVLKEDTYTEAVQEQEEGTVLLYNKDNALPMSNYLCLAMRSCSPCTAINLLVPAPIPLKRVLTCIRRWAP